MSTAPRRWSTRRVARRATLALVGVMMLLAGAVPASEEERVEFDPATQPSRPAPLAAQSLLLDAAQAGDRMVAVGQHGHVLLSDDRGETWRQVVAPTRSTLTAVTFPTERDGFAVGHDAVILRTRDAGETWALQHVDSKLESPLLDVWFADASRGLAVGAYGLVLETRDGGETWSSRMLSDLDVHHNAIAANASGQLFVAGERGSLFRSDDAGETWQPLEVPVPASLFGAIGVGERGVVVFGLRGRVFHSADGGESWRSIETGTRASLMGGAVSEAGEMIIGGITGVLVEGPVSADRLALGQRPDRKAVATAEVLPGGGVLLLGAFGVEAVYDALAGTPLLLPLQASR